MTAVLIPEHDTDIVGPAEQRTSAILAAVPDDSPAASEGVVQHTVAVLLPCRNEAPTVARVVHDFHQALPEAAIYVYDNASDDGTADIAAAAGAIVRHVPELGKGNVVRRMFAEIDAVTYVLVDGDDTYDAADVPQMIGALRDGRLDMVVGRRIEVDPTRHAFRPGHRLGNRLLTRSVRRLFGGDSQDMLSGYRVFSRNYVKSFPALSHGFELETEMTVHSLELRLPFVEVPTGYRDRPDGSASKLRTIPDGLRILRFILLLCKDHRPLRFFGSTASLLALTAAAFGLLGRGHLNTWSPDTVTGAGLMLVATVSFLVGVILDSVNRSQRDIKRMLYLALQHGPSAALDVGIRTERRSRFVGRSRTMLASVATAGLES